MWIILHIFVVLINYIMESKEIILVPKADAIIPPGVVDEPSVCGTFNFNTMAQVKEILTRLPETRDNAVLQ